MLKRQTSVNRTLDIIPMKFTNPATGLECYCLVTSEFKQYAEKLFEDMQWKHFDWNKVRFNVFKDTIRMQANCSELSDSLIYSMYRSETSVHTNRFYNVMLELDKLFQKQNDYVNC